MEDIGGIVHISRGLSSLFPEVSLKYLSMSAESEEVLACDNSSQWIGLEQRRCDNFRPESKLRPDANPVAGAYFCRIMQNFCSNLAFI